MHQGRFVFAQLMDHLPLHAFRRAVKRYDGDRYVKRFSCLDQFLCMAFAQLGGCESLRDIEICLRAHQSKLYHLGIRGRVSRSTLANANETRDWRIYADFARHLIASARRLYANDPLNALLSETAYALDSSTIELCLSVFPWARAMHAGRGAIKLHTLLDLRGAIPTVVRVSEGRRHDIHMLDELTIEPGAIYVMDRGYMDFERLHRLHGTQAFFLMRAKKNQRVTRRYSRPVEDRSVIVCDQVVVFSREVARTDYPDALRRLRIRDTASGRSIVLLTNHFGLPAASLATLYRHRWEIEIFFKWIKQHLRIKKFFGTSSNAVLTQIWIAVTVYVLVAVVRKRLDIPASLYEFLQFLSVTLFDTAQVSCAFQPGPSQLSGDPLAKQLILFAD